MEKITDLSNYRNKKLLMNETKKLADNILEQAKQGVAIHTVEQGIWDKLLTMDEQAPGQFIALQGDGDIGEQVEFVPLDNRLQLPNTRFSYLLQDWNQQLFVENPFNQVINATEEIFNWLEIGNKQRNPANK